LTEKHHEDEEERKRRKKREKRDKNPEKVRGEIILGKYGTTHVKA